jgi:FkbM family methyltransferase
MKKLITYIRYFYDYIVHGDFVSIMNSITYVLFKKSHPKDRIVMTRIGTFYCRKHTNDFQFANYYYEWGVRRYLLRNIRNFDVFIDGGACTGDYSVMLSNLGIRCIAFEPVKTNFEVMLQNLALNNLSDKVLAYELGLGEVPGKIGFNFNPVNTGASHIARNTREYDFVVSIQKFDNIYKELGLKPTDRIFFKLDIEGMEAEAIKGSREFIREFPFITFILEDKHTGQNPITMSLLDEALFEFGAVDEFNIFAKKTGNH